MSKSYHKSNNLHHAFINYVCYSSNKTSKIACNKKLRRIIKNKLKKAINNNSLEDFSGYIKTKEVMDVYSFASDGLKQYIRFKDYPYFTLEDIRKLKRK